MSKGEVGIVFFALHFSLCGALRLGTMCTPSGSAIKGRSCHDAGVATGDGFFRECVSWTLDEGVVVEGSSGG